MSNVTITGNLTKEPELRFTASGRAQAKFTVADNRRWQDGGGNWQESVSFVNVVVWGSLAENCAESLEKGHRVIVSGRLDQRSFEREDGSKGTVYEVVADEVGPTLKWATAEVRRNERREGSSASSGSSSRQSGGGDQSQPSAPAADEEPF